MHGHTIREISEKLHFHYRGIIIEANSSYNIGEWVSGSLQIPKPSKTQVFECNLCTDNIPQHVPPHILFLLDHTYSAWQWKHHGNWCHSVFPAESFQENCLDKFSSVVIKKKSNWQQDESTGAEPWEPDDRHIEFPNNHNPSQLTLECFGRKHSNTYSLGCGQQKKVLASLNSL